MVIPRRSGVWQPPLIGVEQAARNRSRRAAVAGNHRRVDRLNVDRFGIQGQAIQSIDNIEDVGFQCEVPVQFVVDTEMVSAEGVPIFNSSSSPSDVASTSGAECVLQDMSGVVSSSSDNLSLSIRNLTLPVANQFSQSIMPSIEFDVENIQLNTVHKRTCFEASNFGGPVLTCPDCNAFMWYDERVDLSRHATNPRFNPCCKQGLISMPQLRSSPPFLDTLLSGDGGRRGSKFREQIRLYNSIFQFTSMGGVVDNTVCRHPFLSYKFNLKHLLNNWR